MQIAHEAFEAFFQYMGIDLRGRNVGMTEQRLHDPKIGPVVQEVAGKSVTQNMRADLCRPQSGGRGQRLEFTREMLARQMTAVAERREQPF